MARPKKITEECVEFTVLALSRRLVKSAIKRLLKAQFMLSTQSCNRVLTRAREQMLAATKRGKDEHCMDALNFYESVIRDPKTATRDKLLAQERIDKLLGLDAPAKQELSGPGGGPIMTRLSSMSDEELASLDAEAARQDGLSQQS